MNPFGRQSPYSFSHDYLTLDPDYSYVLPDIDFLNDNPFAYFDENDFLIEEEEESAKGPTVAPAIVLRETISNDSESLKDPFDPRLESEFTFDPIRDLFGTPKEREEREEEGGGGGGGRGGEEEEGGSKSVSKTTVTGNKRLFSSKTPRTSPTNPSPPRKKFRMGASPSKTTVVITDVETNVSTAVRISSPSKSATDNFPLHFFQRNVTLVDSDWDGELKNAIQLFLNQRSDDLKFYMEETVFSSVPDNFDSLFFSDGILEVDKKSLSIYYVLKAFCSYVKENLNSFANVNATNVSEFERTKAVEWLTWLSSDEMLFDLGLFFTLGESSTNVFAKNPKITNEKDNFLTCRETGLFLLFLCKDELTIDVELNRLPSSVPPTLYKKNVKCGTIKECVTNVCRKIYGESFVAVDVRRLSVDYVCQCMSKPGVLKNHPSGWYETCWLLQNGFADFVKLRLENDEDAQIWMREYAKRDAFTKEEYLEAKKSLVSSIEEVREDLKLTLEAYKAKHEGRDMDNKKRRKLKEYKLWAKYEATSVEQFAEIHFGRPKAKTFGQISNVDLFDFLRTSKNEKERLDLLNAFLTEGSTKVIDENNAHFYSSWNEILTMMTKWFNVYVMFFQQACANFTRDALMTSATVSCDFTYAITEEERRRMTDLEEDDRTIHDFLERRSSEIEREEEKVGKETTETDAFSNLNDLYDNMEFILRGTPFVKQSKRSRQKLWLRKNVYADSPTKFRRTEEEEEERRGARPSIDFGPSVHDPDRYAYTGVPYSEPYSPPIFNSLFSIARTIWKNLTKTMENTLNNLAVVERTSEEATRALQTRRIVARFFENYRWMEDVANISEYESRLEGYGSTLTDSVKIQRSPVTLQQDSFCGILSMQNVLIKLGFEYKAPTWNNELLWINGRALENLLHRRVPPVYRKRVFVVDCIDSFATEELTWNYNFNVLKMIEILATDSIGLIINDVTIRKSLVHTTHAHWISVFVPTPDRDPNVPNEISVMDTVKDEGNVNFEKRYKKLIRLFVCELYRYVRNPELFEEKKREQGIMLGRTPSEIVESGNPALLALSLNAQSSAYSGTAVITAGTVASSADADVEIFSESSPAALSLISFENNDPTAIPGDVALLASDPNLSSEMRNVIINIESVEDICKESFMRHARDFERSANEIDAVFEKLFFETGETAAQRENLVETKTILTANCVRLLHTLFSSDGLLFLSSSPSDVGTIGNNGIVQTWSNVVDPNSNPESQLTTLVSMLDHPNSLHVFTLQEERRKVVFFNAKTEVNNLSALLNRLVTYCGNIDLISTDPNETESMVEERRKKRSFFDATIESLGNFGKLFEKTMVLISYACALNIQKRLPNTNSDINGLLIQLINADVITEEGVVVESQREKTPSEGKVLSDFVKGCYIKLLETIKRDASSNAEKLCFTSIKPIRSYATQDLTNLPIVLSLVQSSETSRISSLISSRRARTTLVLEGEGEEAEPISLPRLSNLIVDTTEIEGKSLRFKRQYVKSLSEVISSSQRVLFDKTTIEFALNRFQKTLEDLLMYTGLELNLNTGLYGYQHHRLLSVELTKILTNMNKLNDKFEDGTKFYKNLEKRSSILDRPSGVPSRSKRKEEEAQKNRKKLRTHLDLITNVKTVPIPICRKKIWFKPIKEIPTFDYEEEGEGDVEPSIKDVVTRRFNIIAKALFPRLYPLNLESLYEDILFPMLLYSASSFFVPEDYDITVVTDEGTPEKSLDDIKSFVTKESKNITKAFETFDSEARIPGTGIEPSRSNTKGIPLLSVVVGSVKGEPQGGPVKIKAMAKSNDVPDADGKITIDDFTSETFVEIFGVPLFDSYSYERTSVVISFKRFFDELNEACQMSFSLNAFATLLSPIPEKIVASSSLEEEEEEEYAMITEEKKRDLLINAQEDIFKKWTSGFDIYQKCISDLERKTNEEITLHFVNSHPNGVENIGEAGSEESIPDVRSIPYELKTVSLFKTYCFLSDTVRTSVSGIFSMLAVIIESIPRRNPTGSSASPFYVVSLRKVQKRMVHFKELVYGLSAIKKLLARCREHVEVAFNMTLSGIYDPSDYYGDQIGRCNLKTLLSMGTDDVFFKMMHLLVIGDGLNNLVNVISVVQRFFFVLVEDGEIFFSKREEMRTGKREAFHTKFKSVYLSEGADDEIVATDLQELFCIIFNPVMTASPVDGNRYENAFTSSDDGKKTKTEIGQSTLMLETPGKWTTILDEAFRLKRTVSSEGFDDAAAWNQLTAVCLSCLTGPTNVYEEFVLFFSVVYPLLDESSDLTYHHQKFEKKVTKKGSFRKGTTEDEEYVVTSFFSHNVPNPLGSSQNAAVKTKASLQNSSSLLAEAREKWIKLFSNPFRKVDSMEKLLELRDWLDRWSPFDSTLEENQKFFQNQFLLNAEESEKHQRTMEPQSPPHVYRSSRSPVQGPPPPPPPSKTKSGEGSQPPSPLSLLTASVRLPTLSNTVTTGVSNALIESENIEETELTGDRDDRDVIDLVSRREEQEERMLSREVEEKNLYELDDDLIFDVDSDVPPLSWENTLLTKVLEKYKTVKRVADLLAPFETREGVFSDAATPEFLIELLAGQSFQLESHSPSFVNFQNEMTKVLFSMFENLLENTVLTKEVPTAPPSNNIKKLYNISFKTWLSLEIRTVPIPESDMHNSYVAMTFYRSCNDDKLWYEICSTKMKISMCGNEEDKITLPPVETETSDVDLPKNGTIEKFYCFYVETYDMEERKNAWYNDINNVEYDFVRVDKPYLSDFDDRYEQKFSQINKKSTTTTTTTTKTISKDAGKKKKETATSSETVSLRESSDETERINKKMPYCVSIIDLDKQIAQNVKETRTTSFSVSDVDDLVDKSLNSMPYKTPSLRIYDKKSKLWTELKKIHEQRGRPVIVPQIAIPNAMFVEKVPGDPKETPGRWKTLDSSCDVFAISKSETKKEVFCVYANGETMGNSLHDQFKFLSTSENLIKNDVTNDDIFVSDSLRIYDDFIVNYVADVFANNVVGKFVGSETMGRFFASGLQTSTLEAKRLETEHRSPFEIRTYISVFQSHRENLNSPNCPYTSGEQLNVLSSNKKNAGFRRRIIGRTVINTLLGGTTMFLPSFTNFLRPLVLMIKEGAYERPPESEEFLRKRAFEPTRTTRCKLLYSSVLIPLAKPPASSIVDPEEEEEIATKRKRVSAFPFSFLDRDFDKHGIESGTSQHVCAAHALTNYKCDVFSREIPSALLDNYLLLARISRKQTLPATVYDLRYVNNQVNAMSYELEALLLEVCLSTFKYDMFKETYESRSERNRYMKTTMYGHNSCDGLPEIKQKSDSEFSYNRDAHFDLKRYFESRENDNHVRLQRSKNSGDNAVEPLEAVKSHIVASLFKHFFRSWTMMWICRDKMTKPGFSVSNFVGDVSNAMSLIMPMYVGPGTTSRRKWIKQMVCMRVAETIRTNVGSRFQAVPCVDLSKKRFAHRFLEESRTKRYGTSQEGSKNAEKMKEELVLRSNPVFYNDCSNKEAQNTHPLLPYIFTKRQMSLKNDSGFDYEPLWIDLVCFARSLTTVLQRIPIVNHGNFLDGDEAAKHQRMSPFERETSFLSTRQTYCRTEDFLSSTNDVIETILDSFVRESCSNEANDFKVDYRQSWSISKVKTGSSNCPQWRLANALCDHFVTTFGLNKIVRTGGSSENEVEIGFDEESVFGSEMGLICLFACWKICLLKIANADALMIRNKHQERAPQDAGYVQKKCVESIVELEYYHFVCLTLLPAILSNLKSKQGNIVYFAMGLFKSFLAFAKRSNLETYKDVDSLVLGEENFGTEESESKAYCELTIRNDPVTFMYYVAKRFDQFGVRDKSSLIDSINNFDRKYILKTMFSENDWIRKRCAILQRNETFILIASNAEGTYNKLVPNPEAMLEWKAMNNCKEQSTALKLRKHYDESLYRNRTAEYVDAQKATLKDLTAIHRIESLQRRFLEYEGQENALVATLEDLKLQLATVQSKYDEAKTDLEDRKKRILESYDPKSSRGSDKFRGLKDLLDEASLEFLFSRPENVAKIVTSVDGKKHWVDDKLSVWKRSFNRYSNEISMLVVSDFASESDRSSRVRECKRLMDEADTAIAQIYEEVETIFKILNFNDVFQRKTLDLVNEIVRLNREITAVSQKMEFVRREKEKTIAEKQSAMASRFQQERLAAEAMVSMSESATEERNEVQQYDGTSAVITGPIVREQQGQQEQQEQQRRSESASVSARVKIGSKESTLFQTDQKIPPLSSSFSTTAIDCQLCNENKKADYQCTVLVKSKQERTKKRLCKTCYNKYVLKK
jgi:hypothetical protein